MIEDDCVRTCLCMSVWGADRTLALRVGFNSKRTCEFGHIEKCVYVGVCKGGGQPIDAAH